MDDFRSVRSIALYDSCVIIKNTYKLDNGQRWDYEHPFHETDLGSWEIEGYDIEEILSHFGIKTSSKMEGKNYSVFRACQTFGKGEFDNYEIIDVQAKIDAPFLLSIKVFTQNKKKKETFEFSYSGKFSIEWQREKPQNKLTKRKSK